MSCLESAQREDFHERQAGRLALHPVPLVLSFSGFATENAERPAEAGPFYLPVVRSRIMQGSTGKNSELLFPYPRKTSRNSRLMCAASCAASSINSTHFFPVGSNSI
jgi:hypothetical protein